MCQFGENLGFCCGFCEISTADADLLIRNGTVLRVGANGFEGKAHVVWMGVEMWERGRFRMEFRDGKLTVSRGDVNSRVMCCVAFG
jgi:hypothetical protein